MAEDIYVYLHELPDGINEAVLTCSGGYTIYIDPRQSKAGCIRSYQHALEHINKTDFEKTDVQNIEFDAHNKNVS